MIAMKRNIRRCIEDYGIVPSIRLSRGNSAADDALFAAETLTSAGIPIVEISLTEPGAVNVMAHLSKNLPEMIIGADVLDVETAQRCLDSGARFITSPGFFSELIEFGAGKDVVVLPGALTPTEVVTAWKSGADLVKVFPCSQVGGAGYIKALHGPMPQIPLIASGGVNQSTAMSFVLSGATALGIGAELVPRQAIQGRRDSQIRELARRFLTMVKEGRTQRMGQV